MLVGAIEAGGTKFVCAVGNEQGDVQEQMQFPTTVPDETMAQVMAFFQQFNVQAIGVGSFGPIEINRESGSYGSITSTPKLAWAHYPMVDVMKNAFRVPVGFNTDVNVAALGESLLGAAKGLDSCLYMTVGTGIGAGAVVNGQLLQGWSHPEMGHIMVRRHLADSYKGTCPYHADCLEGLAAGPAVERRWGQKGMELADREDVWEMEAFYLAQALVQYVLILSPKRIILGGGVMKQAHLFPLVRKHVGQLLNGYMTLPVLEDYIVPPALGDRAGITGALLLGKQEWERSRK